MTTNNLTEQWKKGELLEGVYYYIKINGKIIPARLSKYGNFYLTEGACGRNAMRKVDEVLAEVPDYLIWKNYVNGYCEEHEYNLQLIEENQKLKELLETCQTYLDVHSTEDGDITINDITTTAFIGIIEEALNG